MALVSTPFPITDQIEDSTRRGFRDANARGQSSTAHGIEDQLPPTAIDDFAYSSSESETENMPEKAPSWSPWGVGTLKRLVRKAGGAVSDKLVAFLKSQ